MQQNGGGGGDDPSPPSGNTVTVDVDTEFADNCVLYRTTYPNGRTKCELYLTASINMQIPSDFTAPADNRRVVASGTFDNAFNYIPYVSLQWFGNDSGGKLIFIWGEVYRNNIYVNAYPPTNTFSNGNMWIDADTCLLYWFEPAIVPPEIDL